MSEADTLKPEPGDGERGIELSEIYEKPPEDLNHEMYDDPDAPKGCLETSYHYFSEAAECVGLELPDVKELSIENKVADTTDLPGYWTYFAFGLYQVTFWALAAYFFAVNYIQGRTSSFITLDNSSGVCKGSESSTTCCEVPSTGKQILQLVLYFVCLNLTL
jgi:hypothetical protein